MSGGGFLEKGSEERELPIAEEVERMAMEGREAVLANGFAMFARAVTGVVVPAVVGVAQVLFGHVFVAVGLGQNACGGYVLVLSVAFHDGGEGKVLVGRKAVAVDNDKPWARGECVEGAVHGHVGGAQDVEAVYFFHRGDADGPTQGIALYFGA